MTLPGVTQLIRLTTTDSTQTVARFLADQGAPTGTLVWADRQTAGRGRMARKWESAEGGLYASLILRPSFKQGRLAKLSLETARAAGLALQELTGLQAAIKPPNDVMVLVDGKPRKVCGILIEASGGGGRLDWVVIGVGINVNNKPTLARATNLKETTGKAWPVESVLREFLACFEKSYRKLGR